MSVETHVRSTRARIERQRATLARCHAAGMATTEGQRLLSLLEDFHELYESQQCRLADQLLVLTVKLWQAH